MLFCSVLQLLGLLFINSFVLISSYFFIHQLKRTSMHTNCDTHKSVLIPFSTRFFSLSLTAVRSQLNWELCFCSVWRAIVNFFITFCTIHNVYSTNIICWKYAVSINGLFSPLFLLILHKPRISYKMNTNKKKFPHLNELLLAMYVSWSHFFSSFSAVFDWFVVVLVDVMQQRKKTKTK